MYFYSSCASCGERRIASYNDVASWDSIAKVWKYFTPQRTVICPCKGGVLKYFAAKTEPYIPKLGVEHQFEAERLAKAGLEVVEATAENLPKPAPKAEGPLEVVEAPKAQDPVSRALQAAKIQGERDSDEVARAWGASQVKK